MQEIRQILENNAGNRLTQELIIGMHAMIVHCIKSGSAEESQQTADQSADSDGQES